MADLLGKTLGPYTVTERLGRGGMAEVYKAFHTGLSVNRAIKVIRGDLAEGADFKARFQKEAHAVASLRHPNIVQVNDFGVQDGLYYMVMEYIDGRDLKKFIRAGTARSVSTSVDLVIALADALAYAHARHIVHRDVKPENIMITQDGMPVLMDFGISRLLTDATRLTQTGAGIGTPAYMAPEQALGAREVGPQADVYSLSIVLFELLTGCAPFDADTPVAVMMKALNDPLPLPRALRPEISDALQGVIVKATAKDPAQRYADAGELRDALRALADAGRLTTSAATTRIAATPATPVRSPLVSTRAVAVVVFVFALAGGGAWWYSRPPERLTIANAREATELPAADSTISSPGNEHAPSPTPIVPVTVVPEPIAPLESRPQSAPVVEPDRTDEAPPRIDINGSTIEQQSAVVISAPQVRPESLPETTPDIAATTTLTTAPRPAPITASVSDDRVVIGATSQRDLLRLFGGPDIATRDADGREVWVYQRTSTESQSTVQSQVNDKSARLGLFFGSVSLGAGGEAAKSSSAATTQQRVETMTVKVTFNANRTVADYRVDTTHF